MAAVARPTFHAPRHAGRAPDVSYAVQGTAADRMFGAFTSLGAIYLLFGLTVLLEIQVGAAALPEAHFAVLGQAMCRRHLSCRERSCSSRMPSSLYPSPQSTLAPAPTSAVPPMVCNGLQSGNV